ncbi:Fpg/Nei family DNA glycosylase [Motilibacter aurantiacus]|uniref:Fpg/Nei family DNA glycosylase n=1 Tax=Motilibacter aurantiacus TaxID=2714955 RepID=UPI00140A4E97|nr:DNA-formamidopyrimidine glycosylase family protein [Motilibacter aurantiacus]NHC45823.1 Fpg/Nei family DNA glycosylase [Motilibacter aurantiacus]
MPEGHSLHRYADALRADLVSERLQASSPQGKFAAEAALLDGTTLESSEAYGKNLLLAFTAGGTVHVHLGLRGLFLRYDDPRAEPRKGTRLRLAGERAAYDLIAPMSCTLLDDAAVARLLSGLGPDPLRPEADGDEAVRRLLAHPRSVGAALLDQAAIAGVGNVYRAEVLYRHRLDPRTPAREVPAETYAAMWEDLRSLMARGVRVGSILTVDDAPDDTPPEQARYVYKQQACRGCGGQVRAWALDGRDCYACEREQLRS